MVSEWINPEDLGELRKILRIEARLAVLLEEEVAAKEAALERTKRLKLAADALIRARMTNVWEHWKSYLIDDGKKDIKEQIRKNADHALGRF